MAVLQDSRSYERTDLSLRNGPLDRPVGCLLCFQRLYQQGPLQNERDKLTVENRNSFLAWLRLSSWISLSFPPPLPNRTLQGLLRVLSYLGSAKETEKTFGLYMGPSSEEEVATQVEQGTGNKEIQTTNQGSV